MAHSISRARYAPEVNTPGIEKKLDKLSTAITGDGQMGTKGLVHRLDEIESRIDKLSSKVDTVDKQIRDRSGQNGLITAIAALLGSILTGAALAFKGLFGGQ